MVKAEEEAMRAAMMVSFMLIMIVDYFWCGNFMATLAPLHLP
jgi:hypothetical protein